MKVSLIYLYNLTIIIITLFFKYFSNIFNFLIEEENLIPSIKKALDKLDYIISNTLSILKSRFMVCNLTPEVESSLITIIKFLIVLEYRLLLRIEYNIPSFNHIVLSCGHNGAYTVDEFICLREYLKSLEFI